MFASLYDVATNILPIIHSSNHGTCVTWIEALTAKDTNEIHPFLKQLHAALIGAHAKCQCSNAHPEKGRHSAS